MCLTKRKRAVLEKLANPDRNAPTLQVCGAVAAALEEIDQAAKERAAIINLIERTNWWDKEKDRPDTMKIDAMICDVFAIAARTACPRCLGAKQVKASEIVSGGSGLPWDRCQECNGTGRRKASHDQT